MKIAFLDFILLFIVILGVTQIIIPFFLRLLNFKIDYFWLFFKKKSIKNSIETISELKSSVDSLKNQTIKDIENKIKETEELKEKLKDL